MEKYFREFSLLREDKIKVNKQSAKCLTFEAHHHLWPEMFSHFGLHLWDYRVPSVSAGQQHQKLYKELHDYILGEGGERETRMQTLRGMLSKVILLTKTSAAQLNTVYVLVVSLIILTSLGCFEDRRCISVL